MHRTVEFKEINTVSFFYYTGRKSVYYVNSIRYITVFELLMQANNTFFWKIFVSLLSYELSFKHYLISKEILVIRKAKGLHSE